MLGEGQGVNEPPIFKELNDTLIITLITFFT